MTGRDRSVGKCFIKQTNIKGAAGTVQWGSAYCASTKTWACTSSNHVECQALCLHLYYQHWKAETETGRYLGLACQTSQSEGFSSSQETCLETKQTWKATEEGISTLYVHIWTRGHSFGDTRKTLKYHVPKCELWNPRNQHGRAARSPSGKAACAQSQFWWFPAFFLQAQYKMQVTTSAWWNTWFSFLHRQQVAIVIQCLNSVFVSWSWIFSTLKPFSTKATNVHQPE